MEETVIQTQPCFRALADPTRREILTMLAKQPMTIQDVSDQFDMTRAAVAKHLTILAEGNLITIEPSGRSRINRLNKEGFQPVLDWLSFFDSFWDDRMAALKSELEKDMRDD